MSIASLGSVSFSFFQASFTVPASAPVTPAAPVQRPVEYEHGHENRSGFKANSLVTAMMSAFAALGLGQSTSGPAPATSSTANTDTAATSAAATTAPTSAGSTSAATSAATTSAASTTTTTPASTTATTEVAASSDTLEAAVTEFANALYGALQNRSHEGHGHGRHEHERSDEQRQGYSQNHGYNGFVQRLDRLVQSLGAATTQGAATASETAANPSTVTTATNATTTSATTSNTTTASTSTVPAASTSVPATESAAPVPSRRMVRLLSAFTKVMDLLQPQSSPTAGTSTSMADKLKQFLGSLSQSLHTQASAATPSGVGSRLDVTA